MNRNVLLIEDNEQNRYLLTFLLEKHGYEVTSAADGASGIAAAFQRIPAVILLDIQLPTMDGYSVARALRQNSQLSETPIIAVTSLPCRVIARRRLKPAVPVTSRSPSTRAHSSQTSNDI